MKIALVKFESNLAVSIWGKKRKNYKKNEKIIVPKDEVLKLMRLWCTIVKTRELTYKKHKDLFKITKADIKEANQEFEKNVDWKTFEQLEQFVEWIQYVEDCDKKHCEKYAKDLYKKKVEEREEEERKKQEEEEQKKKELEEQKKKEIEERKKLEEEKKKNREQWEAEAQKKKEQEDQEKLDRMNNLKEWEWEWEWEWNNQDWDQDDDQWDNDWKAWDDQKGDAPDDK